MNTRIIPTSEHVYIQIENYGRVHRYSKMPRRIVCLDYSVAEICAALGISDLLVGVASAESSLSACRAKYRKAIAAAPFLAGESLDKNTPDFESVCACNPDIVIGTSYSFNANGGIADAESFERLGIHIYALTATCKLNSSFSDTYEDIFNLGHIFGIEARAVKLVEKIKAQELVLQEVRAKRIDPIRTFVFDANYADKALTCGQSLESFIIKRSGGENIFGDKARQFVSVEWDEVAKANPQAIVIHCFHDKGDGERKLALLRRVDEIKKTQAMIDENIKLMSIKHFFPGIDNVETAIHLAEWFNNIQK